LLLCNVIKITNMDIWAVTVFCEWMTQVMPSSNWLVEL
jgi:hypothetical protein